MDKYILYHDLKDALQHEACPVCALVEQRVDRSIKVMLREGAADGQLIGVYVRARGFCNAHAYRVKEAGEPSAQAVFYRALLETHKQHLERYVQARKRISEPQGGMPLHRFRHLLRATVAGGEGAPDTHAYLSSFGSEERCPVCATAEASERRYVEAIVDYFEGDEEFRERYRNRGVLCSPHVRRLVAEHADRPAVAELLDIQLSRLDQHIEQLRDIERKAAVRCSEEEGSAYRGGWIRAVRLDVGAPGTDTRYKQGAAALKGWTVKP